MQIVGRPIRFAPALGLMDHPGGRKDHNGAVPVVGGIALVLTLVCAVFCVKVTPVPQVPGTATWGFKIVLDTHSQELVDDLTRTTTLVTDDGRSLKPTAWSGSGPGGHHREGVLHFAMPEPQPGAFELRISRAGESKARVFRWTR